jgi:uncharacterized protein YkwD
MRNNHIKQLLPLLLVSTLTAQADIGLNQEKPFSFPPTIKGDFDGNGLTDTLIRNRDNGNLYTFLIGNNSTSATLNKIASGLPESAWNILYTGDFNGNAATDILIQRKSDGNLYTLILNGDGTSASLNKIASGLPESAWNILNTGDFNGDNTTDILIQRKSDGNLYTLILNGDGTSASLNKIASGLPESDWNILDTGDFNGDNTTDILAQRKSDGNLYTILLSSDGTAASLNKIVSGMSDGEWRILPSSNFNDDETTDILAQRKSDGNLYTILLGSDGTTASLNKIVSGVPSSEWSILQIGKIDNDNNKDILIQRKSDGNLYSILLNSDGTSASFNKIISGLPSSEWTIYTNKTLNNSILKDIIVQRKSDGNLYSMHIANDGLSSNLNKLASNLLNSEWTILNTQELHDNGTTNILLQRKSDGNLYSLPINNEGVTLGLNKLASGLPSSAWEIQYNIQPELTIEDKIVQRHNIYRNLDFQDSNLTWDSTLATHAQQWADYLVANYTSTDRANGISPHASHFNKNTHGLPYEGEGENIAWSSNGRGYLAPSPVDITVPNTGSEGSVDAWANEKANYDYGTNETTDDTKSIGHYTQVVWQKTTKVGCGKASGSDGEHVVCRYSIQGNMTGDKPYCTEYSLAPYYTDTSLQFTSAIINNQTFSNTKLIENRTNCTTSEISSETLVFNDNGSGTFQAFDFFNNGGYVVNFNFTSVIENGVLTMNGVVNDMDSFITLNLIGQDENYYYTEAEWSLDKTNQDYYRRSIFKLSK